MPKRMHECFCSICNFYFFSPTDHNIPQISLYITLHQMLYKKTFKKEEVASNNVPLLDFDLCTCVDRTYFKMDV